MQIQVVERQLATELDGSHHMNLRWIFWNAVVIVRRLELVLVRRREAQTHTSDALRYHAQGRSAGPGAMRSCQLTASLSKTSESVLSCQQPQKTLGKIVNARCVPEDSAK